MSASRKRFRLASLFWCVAVAMGIRAQEPDDLANAIIAHIHTRLPAGAQPMSIEDANRVGAFARYIQKRFYYPTNPHDLESAAIAAMDSQDPAADAAVLAQAAIAGMVDSLGHGTRFLTTLGAAAPQDGAASTPASRQVGPLMWVSLPTMKVTDGNTVPTCTDFVHYFETRSEGHVTGIVLDLRGNEGGPLTDSACLAGLFLKKSTFLFQVLSKQGELVKYESKPTVHIDLPVAVLIDGRTDNGGLLVAAVLQDQRRAMIIGEQKANVNGAVASLVFPPGVDRALVLPTGEILLPDKHPLAAGVHIDVSMPANDDDALLAAARDSLAKQH